jgi:predicted ATPase/DNA-binding XRE family transcriptional regulator
MDNALTFGQWLKRRRRGLGLTQRALGDKLGYSSETIRKVEADELRASRQLVERLAQALEVEPAEWPRLTRFARDEGEPDAASLPTQTVQLPSQPRRHNLPAPLTSFVGREKETAEVRQLVTAHRLVTLIGPGGMGKSRLSLMVAGSVLDLFGRGVWLVELASLAEPRLLPQAVAQALGVREARGQPVAAALGDYVRDKPLLLVLDNCEHLIEACADLAQTLLQAGQALHILATSREALRVPGERVYAVPPLSLPWAHERAPEKLHAFESVQLFVDRAATTLPGFALSSANSAAVVQVCRQLDGMPLALELAAARVNVLRVEQIASRLSERFRLVAGGSRTSLPRHHTLRATIDWSHAALSTAERALLRRVSVFAGGWTLELAEAICADERRPSDNILDLLSALGHKSMLVIKREPGQPARYRLLETIRAYGQEQLQAAGEADWMRRRHLQAFAQLAVEAEPHLRQADQGEWIERLRAELDNIRAALTWSLEHGHEVALGVRLAAAIWHFWNLYGYLAEDVRWMDLALKAQQQHLTDDSPETLKLRGYLFVRAAVVFLWMGDNARAAQLAADGLLACQATGAHDDQALAHIMRGNAAWTQGDYARGQQYLDEAIRLAQAEQLAWHEASAHYFLCVMSRSQRDYVAAEQHGQICLRMCRELGESVGATDTLMHLGGMALDHGRYEEAASLFDECVATFRGLNVPGSLIDALTSRGEVALFAGDFATARSCHSEALSLAQELGTPPIIGDVLYMLGNLARREGDHEQAGALLRQSLVLAGGPATSNRGYLAYLRRALGAVARSQGDWPQARVEFGESLRLFQAIPPDARGYTVTLREVALLWVALGRAAEATRLFSVAEAHAAQAGAPVLPVDRAEYESSLAAARATLAEADFATAWAEGQRMTLEEAIDRTLGELSVAAPTLHSVAAKS